MSKPVFLTPFLLLFLSTAALPALNNGSEQTLLYLKALKFHNQAEELRRQSYTPGGIDHTGLLKINKAYRKSQRLVKKLLRTKFNPRYALLYIKNEALMGRDINTSEAVSDYITKINRHGEKNTRYNLFLFLGKLEHYSYGNRKKAVSYYQNAVDNSDGVGIEAQYYLGELYYYQKEYYLALDCFQQIRLDEEGEIDNYPLIDFKYRYFLADIYYIQKNYPEAYKLYQELAGEPGTTASEKITVYTRLAEKYISELEISSAARVFSELAEISPGSFFRQRQLAFRFLDNQELSRSDLTGLEPVTRADTLYLKGIRLYIEGKYGSSFRTFSAILESKDYYLVSILALIKIAAEQKYEQEHIYYLEELSFFLNSSGQTDKALEYYEKIITAFPGYKVKNYYYGRLLIASERAEEGEKQYLAYLQEKNFRESPVYDIALYFDKKGEIARALEAVERLLKIYPDDYTYQYYKGMLLAREKRYTEALTHLLRAEKQNPNNKKVLFQIGITYDQVGKLEKAAEYFNTIIKLYPSMARAYNYLGYLYADKNIKLEEADQLLSTALELDPESIAIIDSWAWVNFRRGELTAARKYILQAIEKMEKENKIDGIIYSHAGDIFNALAEKALAEKYYARAREFPSSEEE